MERLRVQYRQVPPPVETAVRVDKNDPGPLIRFINEIESFNVAPDRRAQLRDGVLIVPWTESGYPGSDTYDLEEFDGGAVVHDASTGYWTILTAEDFDKEYAIVGRDITAEAEPFVVEME